jgi:hypothetical protein
MSLGGGLDKTVDPQRDMQERKDIDSRSSFPQPQVGSWRNLGSARRCGSCDGGGFFSLSKVRIVREPAVGWPGKDNNKRRATPSLRARSPP